jgi:hypothetical protein
MGVGAQRILANYTIRLRNRGLEAISIKDIIDEYNRQNNANVDYISYISQLKDIRKILIQRGFVTFLLGANYFELPVNSRPNLRIYLNGYSPCRGNPSYGLYFPITSDEAIAMSATVSNLIYIKNRFLNLKSLTTLMVAQGLLTSEAIAELNTLLGRLVF